jgi:hypothetical protein
MCGAKSVEVELPASVAFDRVAGAVLLVRVED